MLHADVTRHREVRRKFQFSNISCEERERGEYIGETQDTFEGVGFRSEKERKNAFVFNFSIR